jgi:hypothetical protein
MYSADGARVPYKRVLNNVSINKKWKGALRKSGLKLEEGKSFLFLHTISTRILTSDHFGHGCRGSGRSFTASN